MISIALSLLSILSPINSIPTEILIDEPLTLSTGEELKARYEQPSDEFCLELQDFARLQADQLHAKEYWQRRMTNLNAEWLEAMSEIEAKHKQIHQAYIDEQKLFKDAAAEAIKQRDLARSDLWYWRGASLALALSSTVTVIYLIGR
jgi:hypothetical protein